MKLTIILTHTRFYLLVQKLKCLHYRLLGKIEFTIIVFLLSTQPLLAQVIKDSNDLLLNMIISADQSLNNRNSDSSMFFLNRARELAEKEADSVQLTRIYRKIGYLYEIKGDYQASMKAYYTAISISFKTNQDSERAHCFLGLSNVNFRTANYEIALHNSLQASKIFNQLNDTSNYIAASALTAQVYLGLKKFKESMDIYNELLALAIRTKDSINIVYNMEHIGGVYTFMNKYDTALYFIEKSLKLNQNLNNRIYQGIIYGNIGETKMKQGKYQEALKNLEIALEIETQHDFKSGMIFLHYTFGQTYSRLGLSNKAIDHFEKSLNLIKLTGEIREKPVVYHLLSEHYARTANFKKAYHFSTECNRLKDSLMNLTDVYRIEELKIKNDVEKTEKAYNTLLNEKQLREKELSSSKRIIQLQLFVIILIGMGFVSSIVFAFYIFRKQRELNKANNEKKLLFSIIGHDLRGPVGNIKQLATLIQSSKGTERDALIALLNQPIESTLALLDDLLLWAQSHNNDAGTKPMSVNVFETIHNVLSILTPLSDNKKIRIITNLPKEYYVLADINQFSAIIRNLISNAIKFTSENGQININCTGEKKYVRIFIQDNGVGIDALMIKKILNTNSLISTKGTNNEKGSGLGLNICKVFIKNNGGSFSIESKEGEGSTFYFTLPVYSGKNISNSL